MAEAWLFVATNFLLIHFLREFADGTMRRTARKRQLMKVCSICKRQYADSLKFCLEDGTVLTQAPQPDATLVDPQATLRLTPRETHSGGTLKRRSGMVWVALGGVGLIALIAVAAVALIYQFGSAGTPSNNAAGPVPTPAATPTQTSTASVSGEVESANAEVVTALLNEDPDALGRLLADDYRYVSDVGLTLNKLEVLMLIRTGNLGYEYIRTADTKVEVNKEMNRADLTGRAESKGQLRRQPFSDVAFYRNTFEKRDGRWQLVSETVWHRQ